MTWKDISIKQYYEILDLMSTDDMLVIQEGLIKILYGVDMGDIPFNKLNDYLNGLLFLKEPYKAAPVLKEYTIKGEIFTVVNDMSKITTAQFIDFQEFLKRSDYKNILGCLFVKKGEIYGQNNYNDFLYDNLTMDIYLDVTNFFTLWLKKSFHHTVSCSVRELRRKLRKTKDKTERMKILRQIIVLKQADLQISEGGQTEYQMFLKN